MKKYGGYLVCLVSCILALGLRVFSQAARTAPSVAVIDTDAFYNESSGIKRLSDALRPLEDEVTPYNDEIAARVNKYKELTRQAEEMAKRPGGCPAILDDIKKVELLIRGTEAKAKEFYEKRRDELTKPWVPQISAALKEFAATRGYALIVDKSQLTSGAIIIENTGSDFPDITTDFIKFFNDKYPTTQN